MAKMYQEDITCLSNRTFPLMVYPLSFILNITFAGMTNLVHPLLYGQRVPIISSAIQGNEIPRFSARKAKFPYE